MQSSTQRGRDGESVRTPMGVLGPRMTVLVGACALVVTARALGMDWLAAPVFGVPSGLWAVGIAMLLAQYRRQRELENADVARAGVLSTRLDLRALPLDRLRARWPGPEMMTGMLEIVGVPAATWDHARKTIGSLGARLAPGSGVVRIGVDLADADAEALIAVGRAEGGLGVGVEWVRVKAGLVTEVERDLAGLDALVRRERRGDINVFVPEHPSRPAAWYDWAVPPPLGYASVFPQRIDPARVSLSGCELSDGRAAGVAARMVLACAMLGRGPGRLGVGRRLVGRTELPGLTEPDGAVDMVMGRLGLDLRNVARQGLKPAPGYVRAAARAVGAWAVRDVAGRDDRTRAELARACAGLLEDEPEALLREAALGFAAGDADAAEETLARACAVLRLDGRVCESDPLGFIMSEVELGSPGRLTLGRIAAGLGLLWATSPAENLAYLRDDLMDELSRAGWLSERAADVELLERVMEMVRRELPEGTRARAA